MNGSANQLALRNSSVYELREQVNIKTPADRTTESWGFRGKSRVPPIKWGLPVKVFLNKTQLSQVGPSCVGVFEPKHN